MMRRKQKKNEVGGGKINIGKTFKKIGRTFDRGVKSIDRGIKNAVEDVKVGASFTSVISSEILSINKALSFRSIPSIQTFTNS